MQGTLYLIHQIKYEYATSVFIQMTFSICGGEHEYRQKWNFLPRAVEICGPNCNLLTFSNDHRDHWQSCGDMNAI